MTAKQAIAIMAKSYRPFNVGDRIIVKANSKYTYGNLINETGTVRRVYPGNVAVELDTVYNNRSSEGLFYFGEEHLEHIRYYEACANGGLGECPSIGGTPPPPLRGPPPPVGGGKSDADIS